MFWLDVSALFDHTSRSVSAGISSSSRGCVLPGSLTPKGKQLIDAPSPPNNDDDTILYYLSFNICLLYTVFMHYVFGLQVTLSVPFS